MRPLTIILAVSIAALTACVQEPSTAPPAQAPDAAPSAAATPPAPVKPAPPERPSPQLDLANKTVVAGEIKDFGDRDIRAEGYELGAADARADTDGFTGVSPCAVLQPADLSDWPGGIGRVSSERNNVGDIVLGCVYTFLGSPGEAGGRVSVYFSDNQTAEQARDSVQDFGEQPGNRAVTDWGRPASYGPTGGDFVWAHGRTFVTLVIEHPAVAAERLAWSKRLATTIDARL